MPLTVLADPTMQEYITAAIGAFTSAIPAAQVVVLGGVALTLYMSVSVGRDILRMLR